MTRNFIFTAIVTMSFVSSAFCANTISSGGLSGIVRTQSADPLGKDIVNIGGALEYSREWDYISSVNASRDGSPSLLSGVGYVGYGLLNNLDLGLCLPAYYDRPNFGSSNAKGLGDLEFSMKLSGFLLKGEDRVFTTAYYLGLKFPTGDETSGFFPRHAYYGSEGNWSSGRTIVSPMVMATIHFDRLRSPAPIRLHFNLGGAFNAPEDNNAVTAAFGVEVIPADWITFFTEVSMEERFVTIHKEHPFADLSNDPIYVTPGVKLTHKKSGLYFMLAGDFGISESDHAFSQVSYTETGKTVRHQANLLYNVMFGLGWQKPAPAKIVDADNDGILDSLDKCPTVAGIAANNGCPDVDSDNDGIVDRLDKCANEAEDKDGFQDEDGCPDRDNDGDGIPDSADKCPDKVGIAANNGCPDVDSDNDGIPDRLDKCPNQAEDIDGFQDDDGCPDLDNDGDGFLDSLDKCPNNPGVAENQGCPKTKEIARGALILKGVNFESGKAVLLAGSYKVLDEMAESLREWPEVTLEIQGHTDNTGKAATNLTLSQARAETVRQYLIDKGISSDRLTAVGYGPDRPIADNKTSAGRAQNRRVEINRLR